MGLSLQTDYALRTLIYLAARRQRATAGEVARFFHISEHHVAKVVHQLRRFGYIRSLRGVGGGIELARQPDSLSVGEVIQTFEGRTHLLECVGTDNVCVIQPNCRLRGVLARAEKIQMDYLKSVRLSDLVEPGGQLLELLPTVPHLGSPA
jgi:Rrf2 family nitric oxide-sensitive transcriptional repressor